MSIEHEIRDEMFYAFLERAGNGCLFLVRFLWGSHYYFFVDVVDERKVKNIMDVINRQAAIKDAESWVAVDEYEKHLQKNVVEWLKEFLSAEHGTNLAEVGTDCCISRQAVFDALRKLREEDIEDYGCEIPEGFNQDHLDRATFAIKQLPPIQPKRGKWIKTARWGRVYYCNQCRNYLDFDGVNAGRGSTNFCPNCGAKMEGADDE